MPQIDKASSLTGAIVLHQSAVTLKPLTGEVNNMDYPIWMVPAKWWNILGSNEQCWKQEKLGKSNNLSEFNKDQVVIAKELGQALGVYLVCSG